MGGERIAYYLLANIEHAHLLPDSCHRMIIPHAVEQEILDGSDDDLATHWISTVGRQWVQEWWDNHRENFDLFISEFVLAEASLGHPEAAKRRMEALAGLPKLSASEDAMHLASALITEGPLPKKAEIDAFHIAVAAVNGIEYLLTWNCTHIANAVLRPKIEAVCRAHGFEPPIICTPQELMGD